MRLCSQIILQTLLSNFSSTVLAQTWDENLLFMKGYRYHHDILTLGLLNNYEAKKVWHNGLFSIRLRQFWTAAETLKMKTIKKVWPIGQKVFSFPNNNKKKKVSLCLYFSEATHVLEKIFGESGTHILASSWIECESQIDLLTSQPSPHAKIYLIYKMVIFVRTNLIL